MKRFLKSIILCALACAIMLTLVSCIGNKEEETTHNIIIDEPEEGDENDETVKQPDQSNGDEQNWELGEVPLT